MEGVGKEKKELEKVQNLDTQSKLNTPTTPNRRNFVPKH